MPYGINTADGGAPAGYSLPGKGDSFVWLNYDTTKSVSISNAGNWCHPDSCIVPQASVVGPNITPGSYPATVLTNANTYGCAFSDTGWNAPNMPHVGITNVAVANEEEKEEKEVA